ncbi:PIRIFORMOSPORA INDICA-INSENSITIVE PROTEIN 2-LIKE [Salix koriyanagi]|uniref:PIRIFORMOSPORA INDICA-INSENSITIVE PROTEIN 2-LIKE n=1 Tax=Salix koriyanagi TaxID=2511006 RepID=A0A9Q0TCE0_9ROSI|nr:PIRIFORMOSPORA INDICA-INSENSITIVE PROTEIN 2-LIKE [Salix koriyanagi]
MPVSLSDVSSSSYGANLEELVFIENPALGGSLDGIIGNFTNLWSHVPVNGGNLTQLLKLDLSLKHRSLTSLQSSEFLGLSSDSSRNFGVPLFSGECPDGRKCA